MATQKQLAALKKARAAKKKKTKDDDLIPVHWTVAAKNGQKVGSRNRKTTTKSKKTTAKKPAKKTTKKALVGTAEPKKWVETGHPCFVDYIVLKGYKDMKTLSSLSAAKKYAEKLKGNNISITYKVTHNKYKLV